MVSSTAGEMVQVDSLVVVQVKPFANQCQFPWKWTQQSKEWRVEHGIVSFGQQMDIVTVLATISVPNLATTFQKLILRKIR